MKKVLSGLCMALLAMSLLVPLLSPRQAEAKNRAEERQEIQDKTAAELQRLYREVPEAEDLIENDYGYAVLFNTGIKLGILGSAHGRGMAVNNETGEIVYMKMEEQSAGLGLGVKEYTLYFVLTSPQAWENFTNGKGWKGGTTASATATEKGEGGSLEVADFESEGIIVYQLNTKGISLEASIKGTKFYPNKDLNDYSE